MQLVRRQHRIAWRWRHACSSKLPSAAQRTGACNLTSIRTRLEPASLWRRFADREEHSAGAEGRQLPAGLCYAPAQVCSSFAFIHLQCRGSTYAGMCAWLSWPQALFGIHRLSLCSSFWSAVFSIPHFLLYSNRTGFCPPPPNVALPCCTMQRKQARVSSCMGIRHTARARGLAAAAAVVALLAFVEPLLEACLLCGTQQTGS